jgi:hypothetical protein
VGWLEARVAAGQGRTEEAVAGLERVRAGFEQRDIAYDAALATMQLAELLASQGRTPGVKELARQSAAIFGDQGVHSEARRALELFRRAAEEERVNVELVRSVIIYLERARREPQLRYQERGARMAKLLSPGPEQEIFMRSIAALIFILHVLTAGSPTASGQGFGAPDLKWHWAIFACEFECNRRVIPDYHEVAGVLGAMIRGDAVLMRLDRQFPIDRLSEEELLALPVAAAANDAKLRRVSGVINHSSTITRLRFVPRDRDERVSFRLERATLGDLKKLLSAYGDLVVLPP